MGVVYSGQSSNFSAAKVSNGVCAIIQFLLTLCFPKLKKWSAKQLDMECFNLKKPLIIAPVTPVLAYSPLLSASAGGHLLNSLAACCFSQVHFVFQSFLRL